MQSQKAFMQYAPFHAPVAFRWFGGAYIEIGPQTEVDEWHAEDVINVWDYELDEPMIPRTLHAFQVRCDNWIADHQEELA